MNRNLHWLFEIKTEDQNMSLFKKLADHARKSNDEYYEEEARRNREKTSRELAAYEAKKAYQSSLKCCDNCHFHSYNGLGEEWCIEMHNNFSLKNVLTHREGCIYFYKKF